MGVVVVWAGQPLSCERELACSCFASPQYTIPVLPSSPSALSTSGGPLLFVTCWPKWSAGPLRVQVVAVGVSSASSARNPCRPASCLHADLHSTYSRTAVHYRQQLYELRLYSKDRLADFPATKAHKSKQALRRSHHLSIDCSCQRGLCSNSSESIFSLITFELQPPPGYNATFDETHLGRQLTRPGKKGSSPSTV